MRPGIREYSSSLLCVVSRAVSPRLAHHATTAASSVARRTRHRTHRRRIDLARCAIPPKSPPRSGGNSVPDATPPRSVQTDTRRARVICNRLSAEVARGCNRNSAGFWLPHGNASASQLDYQGLRVQIRTRSVQIHSQNGPPLRARSAPCPVDAGVSDRLTTKPDNRAAGWQLPTPQVAFQHRARRSTPCRTLAGR